MNSTQAKEALEPCFDLFVKSVLEAWEDYERYIPPNDRPTITAGARAFLVNCRIVSHLEKNLTCHESNSLVQKGQLRYLRIEADDVCLGVRAKKLRNNLRASNILTQRQIFVQEQFCFPDDEETEQLILGYTVGGTVLEPFIDRIVLTQQSANGVNLLSTLWTAPASVAIPVTAQSTAEPKAPPVVARTAVQAANPVNKIG